MIKGPHRIRAKICGIDRPEALRASIEGGARFVGLVFYERSPRYLAPVQAADLARMVPTGVRTVGLFVDPDDAFLEHVVTSVPLDMIQLHGEESPQRVADIAAAWSLETIKAIKVADAADLERASAYQAAADWLLFDAKPPRGIAALPGGNGLRFDWSLLAGRHWTKPWMLSGGLTPDNVGDAVAITNPTAVDVSSGVEDRPGHKDPERIRRFLAALGPQAPV